MAYSRRQLAQLPEETYLRVKKEELQKALKWSKYAKNKDILEEIILDIDKSLESGLNIYSSLTYGPVPPIHLSHGLVNEKYQPKTVEKKLTTEDVKNIKKYEKSFFLKRKFYNALYDYEDTDELKKELLNKISEELPNFLNKKGEYQQIAKELTGYGKENDAILYLKAVAEKEHQVKAVLELKDALEHSKLSIIKEKVYRTAAFLKKDNLGISRFIAAYYYNSYMNTDRVFLTLLADLCEQSILDITIVRLRDEKLGVHGNPILNPRRD